MLHVEVCLRKRMFELTTMVLIRFFEDGFYESMTVFVEVFSWPKSPWRRSFAAKTLHGEDASSEEDCYATKDVTTKQGQKNFDPRKRGPWKPVPRKLGTRKCGVRKCVAIMRGTRLRGARILGLVMRGARNFGEACYTEVLG